MKTELKTKFPSWVTEKQDRHLIMTNDLDSVLSCTLLNQVQGYEVNAYYSFDGLGLIKNDKKKLIGVDLAMTGEKLCWDNHVTGLTKNSHYNPNSANINTILGIHAETSYNYTQKMAFSTALQVWSYYDIPLPKTDEGKMLLLSIDSSFLGFYNDKFKPIFTKYMKMLEFEELLEFCERHTKNDFYKFKYQYTEHLNFTDGLITYKSRQFVEDCLGFKLYIPDEKFIQIMSFDTNRKYISSVHDLSRDEKVFSYAIINAKEVKYSNFIFNNKGD